MNNFPKFIKISQHTNYCIKNYLQLYKNYFNRKANIFKHYNTPHSATDKAYCTVIQQTYLNQIIFQQPLIQLARFLPFCKSGSDWIANLITDLTFFCFFRQCCQTYCCYYDGDNNNTKHISILS